MPPSLGHFLGASPVLLSSSVAVLANNSAVPDSGQLAYPFRKAIIIDEIRFGFRLASSGTRANLGAVVSVRLNLGRHLFMRDAVPVWLLGTIMSRAEEENLTSITNDGDAAYSEYRWRLPEPLYVGPGEVIQTSFSRGNDGMGSINAQVTYIGRTVPPNQPVPRSVLVPYVAPFVSTLGNTYQQSTEAHLFNPFDRSLRIQRLTGRVFSFVLSDVDVRTMIQRLTPATAGSATTIQITTSWGEKLVPDKTGPSDVFDCLRGAWTMDSLMPAKGVYEVKVWDISTNDQVHVAMVGVREERP